jgi:hypothetical protein
MSFGQLTGATHKTVALHVTGSGCVWLPASPGAHLLSAPDGIGTVSVSTRADSPSNCVKVNGSADLPLVISNQHQVNGSLRGDLVVGTSSSQPGGATISDTVHFTASFQKQLDKFVWLLALALALVLGVGLPLLLMLAAKWWEAKIPGGTLVYERFAIDIAGNEARRDGIPVAYRDGDFVHTGVEVPRRGLRRVDLGSVTLRTRISAAPGARAYVEVDASGRLGASSELDRPYTKRLTGRLPLAVYNRWVVLWDPADRPDTAELLVLVHGTASSNDKRKLMADAATRAPQVFERLVLEARQAGVAAPAPQPATVGAAPWGSPGDAADTTPPWSSPAPNNTGVGAAGSQGTNRSPWDPGPGTGSPWDAPRGDAGGPGPGGNSPWDNPPR